MPSLSPIETPGLRPFFSEADQLLSSYNTLVFYAGLEDGKRLSLITGQLDVADLTSLQQSQAAYLLPALRVVTRAKVDQPMLISLRNGPRLRVALTAAMPDSPIRSRAAGEQN